MFARNHLYHVMHRYDEAIQLAEERYLESPSHLSLAESSRVLGRLKLRKSCFGFVAKFSRADGSTLPAASGNSISLPLHACQNVEGDILRIQRIADVCSAVRFSKNT